MKRILSAILALTLVLSMFSMVSFNASAEEYDSEDGLYKYTVENDEATIVKASALMENAITIPDTLGGYPVVAIGDEAFKPATQITRVAMGDNIKSIGNNAFEGCDMIWKITFGNGIESIGDYAFFKTGDFETLVIPETVTSIGKGAFQQSRAKSITLPQNITTIPESCFFGCDKMTSVSFSDALVEIGNYAFQNCKSLKEITLPETLETIGAEAFMSCDSLEKVVIPDSVTALGTMAFQRCENLKELVIGTGVKALEDGEFMYCSNLEKIHIPDSVTEMSGKMMFHGCDKVKIVCSSTSAAAGYAKENGIPCEYTDVVPATSLTLNAKTIKWPIGKAGHFKPVVLPENASQTLEWTSSNEKVATVNANGKLTAVASGTAIITCKTTDGSDLSATCVVTVGRQITNIRMNVTSLTWGVGKAGHFKPVISPADAYNTSLTWTSSNPKVATVNANGKLTAVAAGTATITCKAKDGSGVSATCKVTVKKMATGLKLNANTIKWPVGKSGHFKPTVTPSAYANQKLSWTSSNTKVATVSSKGLLTAKGVGTTTITCKTTDGSNLKATCTVTVGKAVSSVKLNCATIKWPVGKSGHFKATVAPADAINKSLTWTSSNPSVATVDANGKLTALKEGTTTITCKAKDGSGKYATCKVTVSNKITSLKLNAGSIQWEVGKSASFRATTVPAGMEKNLKWESQNPKVATVDANGKLTAVAAGTALIVCKTTDGSNLSAYCRVLVTDGTKNDCQKKYFNDYFKDGSFVINGSTDIDLEDGTKETVEMKMAVTTTQDYMMMVEEYEGVSFKTITNEKGMYALYPSTSLSDLYIEEIMDYYDISEKDYHAVRNYYSYIPEITMDKFGFENLTFKEVIFAGVDGDEYEAEVYEGTEGSLVTFYSHNNYLCYIGIKSEDEDLLMRVKSVEGSFKISDYKLPAGYVDMDKYFM